MLKRFMNGRVAQIKLVDESPSEETTPIVDVEKLGEVAKDVVKTIFWGVFAYKLLDTGCKILIKHL